MADSYDNIPIGLQGLKQWVLTERDTKKPYQINKIDLAKSNDPSTWSTFSEVVKCINNRFIGIAFAITKNDPYAFIDLDSAFVDSKLTVKARDIINRLDSYSELSLKKKGIHIAVRNSNNDIYIPKHPIEIYSRSHFMTITGDVFENRTVINERESELNEIIKDYKLIPEKPTQENFHRNSIPSERTPKDTDDMINELITRAINKATTEGRNNSGLDLASQLRDHDISIVEAEGVLERYRSQVCDMKDHDYTIAEAMASLQSAYKEPKRGPWWKPKPKNTPGGNHGSNDKSSRAGDPVTTNDIQIVESKQEDKPIKPFYLTDYGNCERLVYYHGENIRYCHDLKKWLIWDGVRWNTDNTGVIVRFAKDVCRFIYKEAGNCDDSDQRKAIANHAKSSESDRRIHGMIELAQSEIEVSILQSQLDSKEYLFNVLNGTIDLETGELLSHKREDLITKLAPVTYDPDARLELWDNFLNTVTNGNEGIKAFLQQAVGYSLTGDTAEEVLFFVHGEASTGKSTFVEAVKAVMGDYAKTADFESFLKRKEVGGVRNDIANLAGARLVTSIEVDEGKALAEGLIKMLTGGDTVRARFLYHEGFDFLPKMKLWLCANHVPKVKHDDEAMWRRILKIPFNHVIKREDRDPQVKKTLKDTSIAGPAILAWAVRGIGLYLEKGKLCVPEDITKATEEYRTSMDTMKPFIDECCILGIAKTAKVSDLHNKYIEWSGNHINRKEFGNRMEALNFKKVKQEAGLFWMGIGISD